MKPQDVFLEGFIVSVGTGTDKTRPPDFKQVTRNIVSVNLLDHW